MKNFDTVATICIAGRPNVGKSSLFNLLLGERRAVVVKETGTTRDRLECVITINKRRVSLVDTGGYLTEDIDALSSKVKEQIYIAVEEADVILMVVDSIEGITPADEDIASVLRKYGKDVIVTANKADNDKFKNNAVEFFKLGFGEPVPISCIHRKGIRDLKRQLRGYIEKLSVKEVKNKARCIKIAVVGRPNVGKSSFVNSIIDRERVIVSDIPGTTRDSIDTNFTFNKADYILIDTAGIRHKRKIKKAVDVFSIMRARESIIRADVVILLLDAAEGMTKDEIGIIKFIEENGKACLVLVNKWDLTEDISDVNANDYREKLIVEANILSKFPISFISAKTGKNVLKSIGAVKELDSNLDMGVPTPFLNKIFEVNSPSDLRVPRAKRRPNFLYIVQSGRRPLEFTYFVNPSSAVKQAHLSFIENRLRDNLPLEGIPLNIRIKGSRKEK